MDKFLDLEAKSHKNWEKDKINRKTVEVDTKSFRR